MPDYRTAEGDGDDRDDPAIDVPDRGRYVTPLPRRLRDRLKAIFMPEETR